MTDGFVTERGERMEFMRRQALFADLADSDLQRLYEMSSVKEVAAGSLLFEEGASGGEMYIVMQGRLEVRKGRAGQEEVLALRGVGEVVGEMALLGEALRTASVHAVEDSRLLVIDRAALAELLSCSPTAAMTIVATVASRLRSTEALLMHQEKMAALGTLAAGLAHELNNPAAAMARSARQLERVVGSLQAAFAELLARPLPSEAASSIQAALTAPGGGAGTRGRESPAPAWELEEELGRWLEELGVERSWELAPALVTAGWGREELEERLAAVPRSHLPAVARCLAAAAELEDLLGELRAGSGAVSELVGAVKSYSHLGEAPVQEVDVRQGLENTLVILRHKLKDGVAVVREYADPLPVIEAYGSELNQVWTNIIDNAIDALAGAGEVRLAARTDERRVVVSICDDGPGIPPEAQRRLFDPFFTTKPVGSGTGLGLHLAHRIVRRHHGEIRVSSRPGRTCFEVLLPLRQPEASS